MNLRTFLGAVLLAVALLHSPAGNAGSSKPANPAQAQRFLQRTTFGPTQEEIDRLSGMSYASWIDEQLALAPTLHAPELLGYENPNYRTSRMEVWWDRILNSDDQLRQRVALALSELFVVSDRSSAISSQQYALAFYYDQLLQGAFGNFRDLLETVTLSPVMGRYLSMLNNQKADPNTGRQPDENYAREVMQLMTIGPVVLNVDGTVKLDKQGRPKPSYTQTDVENMARALTGWSWGGSNTSYNGSADWDSPMLPFDNYHDSAAKTIVGGVVLPAGNSARDDLRQALDALFKHNNTAPFISRLLIQRLVTANPSPAYVKRIAKAFQDNGHGVRGDLGYVVRQILLDKEAVKGTAQNPDFGKPREPILALATLWRTFHAMPWSGTYKYWYPESSTGQAPLSAPSVFGFFSPDFMPDGALAEAQLVAPEWQMANEYSLVRLQNELYNKVLYGYEGYPYPSSSSILIDISAQMAMASDPVALVDNLNVLLTGGQLSADYCSDLANFLATVNLGSGFSIGLNRALYAITLISVSPYFQFQR